MDNSDFKYVDEYQINQLFNAITEKAERPEAMNTRQKLVNIAGTIFDWKDMVITNVERMVAFPEKSLG